MHRRVGHLSGGQQQMLALARALGRRPEVLLADELSLGLAPVIVNRLLAEVRAAADRGLGVLLVEQHLQKALEIADRVYVLGQGQIALTARGPGLAAHLADIQAACFPPTLVKRPARALADNLSHQPGGQRMSTEDNKAVVQAWIAAANAQDETGIDTYIAPDFVNHTAEVFPGTPKGIEGVRHAWAATAEANRDEGVHREIEFQIAVDDLVVTRIMLSGRHTADFLGLPPTGRPWTMGAIVINRVRDGQLVEQWGEVDVLGKLRRLGGEVKPAASMVGAGDSRGRSATA
jgi:energy-coupling factor transporter ATP-binding protein EcfA2